MTKRIVLEGKKAVGIAIIEGAGETVIRVAREVIVSSGAIGSPKLLQLSGIGAREELSKLASTRCTILTGVGANLQDHVDLCIICECSGDYTYDKYGKLWWAAIAGLQYLLTRKGPAASSLFDSGGFWRIDENAEMPDRTMALGDGLRH